MEYIERELVEKMMEDAQIISDGEYCGYCTEDISISSIPAADVAPVVHGRWDEHGKCIVCGGHAPFWCMASTYYTSQYCPNCGAKMDGVSDG